MEGVSPPTTDAVEDDQLVAGPLAPEDACVECLVGGIEIHSLVPGYETSVIQ